MGGTSLAKIRYRMRAHIPLVHARTVARLVFGPPSGREFTIRYWTGDEDSSPVRPPAFTLLVNNAAALRRAFARPSELALAESLIDGDLEIDGDMEAAMAVRDRLHAHLSSPGPLLRIAAHARRLPRAGRGEADASDHNGAHRDGRRHSPARDATVVCAHYDLGNEFYALWLDRSLTYSCAYYETGDESLDAAQTQKLDHICRKLRLAPGERLLDVGCGWGALVRHAARHYGVDALGITLSERQAAWAGAAIRELGLGAHCRVEVCDYRDLATDAPFDKIASVGMFEHVGRSMLGSYFGRLFALLVPGGLLLNHGIVASPPSHHWTWRDHVLWRSGAFIDRYVFPDGELVPLGDAINAAETCGLETRDVETLRDHYAHTLREWMHRLERHRGAVESLVGPRTYRVFRLYLAGSAHAFATGHLSLAQMLFGRPDAQGRVALPLSRRDIYERHPARLTETAAGGARATATGRC